METEVKFYTTQESPPCLHCAYGSTGMEKEIDAADAFAQAFSMRDFPAGALTDVETLLFTALVPGIDYRAGRLADVVVNALKAELELRFQKGLTLLKQSTVDSTLVARYNGEKDLFVVGVGVIDFVRNK